MEVWKEIKGFEGIYEVSNLGRIKSLERYVKSGTGYRIVRSRIIKVNPRSHKYLVCQLFNTVCKRSTVHRIVAESFIPNNDNKPCVNHIDGNVRNNSADNLEWVSFSENTIHSYNVLGNKSVGSRSKPVLQYDINNNFIKRYKNSKEAIKEFGKNDGSWIRRCCRGEVKQCYGYIYIFEENSVLI